jgi:hypothetical protein
LASVDLTGGFYCFDVYHVGATVGIIVIYRFFLYLSGFLFSRAASDAILRSSLPFLNSAGFLSNGALADAVQRSSSEFSFSPASDVDRMFLNCCR